MLYIKIGAKYKFFKVDYSTKTVHFKEGDETTYLYIKKLASGYFSSILTLL